MFDSEYGPPLLINELSLTRLTSHVVSSGLPSVVILTIISTHAKDGLALDKTVGTELRSKEGLVLGLDEGVYDRLLVGFKDGFRDG